MFFSNWSPFPVGHLPILGLNNLLSVYYVLVTGTVSISLIRLICLLTGTASKNKGDNRILKEQCMR